MKKVLRGAEVLFPSSLSSARLQSDGSLREVDSIVISIKWNTGLGKLHGEPQPLIVKPYTSEKCEIPHERCYHLQSEKMYLTMIVILALKTESL